MRAAGPKSVLRDVGRRIAEIRRERGWSQEDLAEELGASVRYVQYVEAGEENLGIAVAVKFANALSVPIIELFTPPTTRTSRRVRRKKET